MRRAEPLAASSAGLGSVIAPAMPSNRG
jgi:hypothetical protein